MLIGLVMAAQAASVTVVPGTDLALVIDQLGPGDLVTFADGLYPLDAPIALSLQGEPDAPIVLQAAPGASPILQVATSDYAIVLEDCRDLVLRGLGVQSASEGVGGVLLQGTLNARLVLEDLHMSGLELPAVRVASNAQFLEIRGLRVDVGGEGILAGCANAGCWLQDSLIADGLFTGLTNPDGAAVHLLDGAQGVSILDNVVAQVAGSGVVVGTAAEGDTNVIAGNTVWQVGGNGISVGGRTRVQNNLLVEISGDGIRAGDSTAFHHVELGFNTVYMAGTGLRVQGWNRGTDLSVVGNALVQGSGPALAVQSSGSTPWDGVIVAGNVLGGAIDGHAPPGGYVEGATAQDFEAADARRFAPTSAGLLSGAAVDVPEELHPSLDWSGVARVSPLDAGALAVGSRMNALAVAPKAQLRYEEPVDTGEVDTSEVDPGGCSTAPGSPLSLVWLGLVGVLLRYRTRDEGGLG